MYTKIIFSALTALSLLASCGGGNATSSSSSEDTGTQYARNLTMEDRDGYTYVTVRNPWDTTRNLAAYALVEKDAAMPSGLPAGTAIVRVPLEKSVVFSSVHASLIDELGAGNAVSGVCDSQFITDPNLQQKLKAGKILDCGNSMQPNIEAIIRSGAGAALISPFESDNGSHGKLSQVGIPIIECADYLEKTPLARAEWMRFYGRLYGKGETADSLFVATEREYKAMSEKGMASKTRPKVLFDKIYSGIWNVPTSGSVTGAMITDAGATNPFSDSNKAGSAQLSPEEVLYKGGDTDFWFVRYSEATPLTMKSLAADNGAYSRFKAFKEGNVYGCNSIMTNVFEDGAFHPQYILADLISIIHPESGVKPVKRYYFHMPEK